MDECQEGRESCELLAGVEREAELAAAQPPEVEVEEGCVLVGLAQPMGPRRLEARDGSCSKVRLHRRFHLIETAWKDELIQDG